MMLDTFLRCLILLRRFRVTAEMHERIREQCEAPKAVIAAKVCVAVVAYKHAEGCEPASWEMNIVRGCQKEIREWEATK